MKNQEKQKIKWTVLKKAVLSAALFCIFIFVLFLLLQSPFFVNALVQILSRQSGFNISVGNISVSPAFSAEIRDLRVNETGNGGVSLYVSYAAVQGGIDNSFRAGMKKAAIHEPRLVINLGINDKKLDLSFLNKLPPVQFMEIINGEIQILIGQDGEIIQVKDINLTLRDFSPKKGGSLKFKCRVSVKSGNGAHENDTGHCEGDFHFSRLDPEPAGNGSIKLIFNNADFKTFSIQNLSLDVSFQINSDELVVSTKGPLLAFFTYKSGDKNIALKDLQLSPHVSYSIRTGNIYATVKNGKISGLGAFEAELRSVLKQDNPWKASIKAFDMNIAMASEIFKAFLPPPYDKWSFQGSGVVKIIMEGDYKDKRLSGSGKMELEFKDGGFSSPNGDIGGLGVGGKIIIGIEIPSQAQRGRIDITSEIHLGEFLWGKYYRDFTGKNAFFLSKGGFHRAAPLTADFSGSLNLGDGGNYTYSGNISPHKWVLQIGSQDISLHEFYQFFFYDYIKQDFPSFSNLDLHGLARFEIELSGKNQEFDGQGSLIIDRGQFSIGDALSGNIYLDLPFDFFYPDELHTHAASPNAPKTGNLHIQNLDTKYVKIKDLDIPLIFSRNTILISGGAVTPLSGIPLKLTHFRGERLFSPERSFTLGVIIGGMEIGSYIEKASGINIPARFQAEFPDIFYKNEVLNIKGNAIIEIFGGRVDAGNIHGRKIFSRSRVIGGDITFEGIHLNELTGYIELGRMSGIVKGFLKGLEVEYGQPSKFILDIESVETKGVAQSVSVDAIENFSIIGSGSQGIGTILKSGLNKFFKEYPYSKMGIMCNLENDVFTLRGKIHERGKEYLIRKAFLRGIDVINQNPENNISFKDMKERINRIFEKARQS